MAVVIDDEGHILLLRLMVHDYAAAQREGREACVELRALTEWLYQNSVEARDAFEKWIGFNDSYARELAKPSN